MNFEKSFIYYYISNTTISSFWDYILFSMQLQFCPQITFWFYKKLLLSMGIEPMRFKCKLTTSTIELEVHLITLWNFLTLFIGGSACILFNIYFNMRIGILRLTSGYFSWDHKRKTCTQKNLTFITKYLLTIFWFCF